MTLEVLWKLPPQGDGRTIAADRWHRGDYSRTRLEPHPFARTGVPRDGYNYHHLLLQIARAAELNGFDGLWIPDTSAGEDPLIVAGSLAREARRLRFVIGLRTPLLSAVYSAKIAKSFQRLSGDRLAWHVNTAADTEAKPWHGRKFTESEYIARSSEFLEVANGFWKNPPFTYAGEYYEVENGGFAPALEGNAFPAVYLSGTSDQALAFSAKYADVHVFPLEPLEDIRALSGRLHTLARAHERTVRIAIDADLLARHSSEDAWSEAEYEWNEFRSRTVPLADGVTGIVPAQFSQTRISDMLWSGFEALRAGPRLGLVGSFSEVEAALDSYVKAGVSTLVLGANPHLEGAYRLGEHLLPFLHRRQAENAA